MHPFMPDSTFVHLMSTCLCQQKQQPPTLNTPSLKLCFCPAAVSKAFSCLSNADNRAAYDRYGDQEGAAGFARQRRAGPTAQGFGGDGFDAEEIFNMFFGIRDGFVRRRKLWWAGK